MSEVYNLVCTLSFLILFGMQSVPVSWKGKDPEEPITFQALCCCSSMPDTKALLNLGGTFLFPPNSGTHFFVSFFRYPLLTGPFLITLLNIKAHKPFVNSPQLSFRILNTVLAYSQSVASSLHWVLEGRELCFQLLSQCCVECKLHKYLLD